MFKPYITLCHRCVAGVVPQGAGFQSVFSSLRNSTRSRIKTAGSRWGACKRHPFLLRHKHAPVAVLLAAFHILLGYQLA